MGPAENLRRLLLFCFFSAAALTGTEVKVHSRLMGDDFHMIWAQAAPPPGTRKFLCRNKCTDNDVLVETSGSHAQVGRFLVSYNNGLHAVIREVRPGDAGLYALGLGHPSRPSDASGPSIPLTIMEFHLGVIDVCATPLVGDAAVLAEEGGKVTLNCNLYVGPGTRKFLFRDLLSRPLVDASGPTMRGGRYRLDEGARGFNVTLSRINASDSGNYWCAVMDQNAESLCLQLRLSVRPAGGSQTLVPTAPLMVLTFLMMLLALLVPVMLLLLKRRRRRKTKKTCHTGPAAPEGEVYVNVAREQ